MTCECHGLRDCPSVIREEALHDIDTAMMARLFGLAPTVLKRLSVPCTPTELASLLERSAHDIRGTLFYLKRTKKAKRLDRQVPTGGRRGRTMEYLWSAT
jgi:hypothetical protein